MKPLGNKIMLDIKEVKIGAIQSDAIEEHGTIIAIGGNAFVTLVKNNPDITDEENTNDLIGKTLYFKAWAVDVITKGQDKYYFISSDSDAICAIE